MESGKWEGKDHRPSRSSPQGGHHPGRLHRHLWISRSQGVGLKGRNEEVIISAGHTDTIFALAITNDGSRAVSGSNDRTIRVWDLKRREALGVAALDGRIVALAASMDATTILVRDGLNSLSCLRLQ